MASFRQLLEDGDVDGLMRAWRRVASHLPQPKNRDQAEIMMHMARTSADTITPRARFYSHRWLTDRMMPSNLPDELKPSAERAFPVIADAVGISVNFSSAWLKPAALEVRGAMEYAVLDRYGMGDKDSGVVQAAMQEARERTMRALFGGGGKP